MTLDKIYHAAFVLKDVARKTDLIEAPKLSKDCQPVSYTHLDVYKRQLYGRRRSGPPPDRHAPRGLCGSAAGARGRFAAKYGHLGLHWMQVGAQNADGLCYYDIVRGGMDNFSLRRIYEIFK